MKLKVWAGNAGEQGLATIVAATSQQQALEILKKHGFKITMYEFRNWWDRTFMSEDVAVAIRAGVWRRYLDGQWERVKAR